MATDCLARVNNCSKSAPSAAGALMRGGSRRPPLMPRTASGFSGRRFCRIFPVGELWMLRVEPGGGGMSTDTQKSFATLNAAIAYAIANEFSYRVFHSSELEAGGKAQWRALPAWVRRPSPDDLSTRS